MKKIFKGLALGLALTAATAAPSFAQDDACKPIYESFIAKYRGKTIEEKKAAIASGEELVAKCSSVTEYADPVAFVNKQLPNLKKQVANQEVADRLNQAFKDKDSTTINADEAFTAGKAYLANNPDTVDVMIALAAVGFDKAAANPPVDKYNAEAINFAKQSIQKLESGAQTNQFGLYKFTFLSVDANKKPDMAASKDNALSWLNYYVGYIMYSRQNMKKDALPYLYKSTQYKTGTKSTAAVYQLIGDFYKDEFNRLDDERLKLAEEAKPLANDDPKKKELADKTKELLALQKGYAERMIDAYARARNNAPAADQAYKDGLYNTIKVLYEVRFDKKDGVDAYISSAINKPMPDPTSTVAPIVEAAPTTTTTTSTTSTSGATITAPANTKPANGATTATTSKPATNGASTESSTKATTNGASKTAPAKKPVAKKKGTR